MSIFEKLTLKLRFLRHVSETWHGGSLQHVPKSYLIFFQKFFLVYDILNIKDLYNKCTAKEYSVQLGLYLTPRTFQIVPHLFIVDY